VSNEAARNTWEARAVGEQRATAPKGTPEYFKQIRSYRYGYETPWISRLFEFEKLSGKSVLEVGVGHGIDGVEMALCGAKYHGIDITRNHIDLARRNFELHRLPYKIFEGDLLEANVPSPFDVVYSFGVLHHIAHEKAYLQKIRTLLASDGKLMIAVYSKYSFFNVWLVITRWSRGRKYSLDDWRSHVAERSDLGSPVVIKIRSRREIEALLQSGGFVVERYYKRGFVQNYIPILGRFLKPDGATLNALGRILGWYHIFICRVG
jgi:SAM-dependent methyltransferase